MFPEADEELELSTKVRQHSSAVPKHPNLRVCNYCEQRYCITPDAHETTITIAKHLERCLAEER